MDESSLCFLESYQSVEDALIAVVGVSRSALKKHGMSKAFLKKKIFDRSEIVIPIDIVNHGLISPDYQGPEIKIIFEDEKIIVLDLPYSVHTHPLKYHEKNNCLSFLRSRGHSKILEINRDSHERGLLYRLDYGVSGVLFYAKTNDLYHDLRSNFDLIVYRKKYLAIVHGNIKEEGRLLYFFEPTGRKGEKMKVSDSSFDSDIQRKGILRLKKLKYDSNHDLSLLSVDLETGLRHQIRSQLSFLGHPILGDEFYGGKRDKRIYLHASEYFIKIGDVEYQCKSNSPELFDGFFDLNC